MNEAKEESKSRNKTVLLFKAPKEGVDPFIQELTANNYTVTCIPVLEFVFINISTFTELLRNPESYSAIVFTSQRTVEATVEALKYLTEVDETLKEKQQKCLDLKCYVVGSSTQKAAQDAGFTPIGADSGNAEGLVEFIIKDIPATDKPLLFPCGNIRQDTIPKAMAELGYLLKELVVYETRRNSSIESALEHTVNCQGLPDFVVYFSPSGVDFTHSLISTHLASFKHTMVIAFGPSTKQALEDRGVPVSALSVKPDAKTLLATIQQIETSIPKVS